MAASAGQMADKIEEGLVAYVLAASSGKSGHTNSDDTRPDMRQAVANSSRSLLAAAVEALTKHGQGARVEEMKKRAEHASYDATLASVQEYVNTGVNGRGIHP